MAPLPNWSLEAAVSYFRENPEIAEHMTNDEVGLPKNADDFRALFENCRFDPRIVMRQMVRNRQSYLMSHQTEVVWDLTNMSGDFAVTTTSLDVNKFSSTGPFSKDLEFLIMTFLLWNNNISKVISKSKSGISEILEMLKEKYDIIDGTRRSGTPLGARDVTLPRIAGVMPAVAVKMFHNQVVKEIVPFHTIPGAIFVTPDQDGTSVDTTERLSHAICCHFLPSVHPKETAATNHIHAIMLFVAIKLDDTIHKKEKDYTSLQDLLTYYKARHESAATPAASRIMVMRKVGLIDNSSEKFSQNALQVNTSCLDSLLSMRADDTYHQAMMNIATTGNLVV